MTEKLLENKIILCLGDSITSGAMSSTIDKSYVSRLSAISGAETVRYGAGGSRIAKQIVPSEDVNLDKYFGSRVKDMQDQADYVIVFGGTNDFGHGDAPLGRLGDNTEDSFYGCVYCLYKMLKTKYPKAKIVAITPLHRENEFIKTERGAIRYHLSEYVNAVKAVANTFSIPVLDLYSDTELVPDIPEKKAEYFSEDGLHPNDLGHDRIANKIYEFLIDLK